MAKRNNTPKCADGSNKIPDNDAAAPEISHKIIALCLGAITSAAWRVDQAFRQFEHDDPHSTLNELLFVSRKQACNVMDESIEYLEREMKKIGIEFTQGSGNMAFEQILRISHLHQSAKRSDTRKNSFLKVGDAMVVSQFESASAAISSNDQT